MSKKVFLSCFVLLAPFWCLGCARVPGTDRLQLMLVSSGQERALGLALWQSQFANRPRAADPQLTALVQRVGARVTQAAEVADRQWEFVVFDSPEVNAFCIPGGKVGIYTGILPVAESEAGLAVIVGHEVAHAVARHSAERISQAMAIQTAGRMVGSAVGEWAPGFERAAMQAFGLTTTLGIALPFSREHEKEADYLGLVYLSRAGYAPEETIAFWERMSRKAGGKVPEFLSTHPNYEGRIEKFREHLPEATVLYAKAPKQLGRGEPLSFVRLASNP